MKRKQLLLLAPSLFLLSGLVSCNPGSRSLTKIEAKVKDGITIKVGDTLTHEKIIVTAVYSDNKNETVGYEYTNVNSYRVSVGNTLCDLSAGKGYKFESKDEVTFNIIFTTKACELKITAIE